MKSMPSAFKQQKETIKDKLKHFFFSVLVYIPFLSILYGGGWYVNQHLSDWVNNYFNVSMAQKTASMTDMRVKMAYQAMSFPIGVGNYVVAQIDDVTAQTKASTLSFAAQTTTSLLKGILCILIFLFTVYIFLKILKQYKTLSSEARIAKQVVNMLLPVLEEINNNIKSNSPAIMEITQKQDTV